MTDRSGNWITYNGEVYNYIELRDELGAQKFLTTSDTEVILRAYLLETTDTSESSEARLLDTVAELLFTRRGEDSREERDRVFQQVYSAWDQRAAG